LSVGLESEKFSARERLKGRRDFEKVYRLGRRYTGEGIVLYVYRVASPEMRLGTTVSKKIREWYRKNKGKMVEGIHLVLEARKELSELSYQEGEAIFLRLLAEAKLLKSGIE
jgi:ribonuclease P protein component